MHIPDKIYGEYDEDTSEIKIQAGLSDHVAASTLIHEVAEKVFMATGDPDRQIDGEGFARLFELGVVDLLVNNSQLMNVLGCKLRW